MNSFDFDLSEQETVPIIKIIGYINEEAGQKLSSIVDSLLENDKFEMIFDFSRCEVINSLAVAEFLTLSIKILDDFKGRLIFSHLNPLMVEVFEFANIFPRVELVKTTQEAVGKILKAD